MRIFSHLSEATKENERDLIEHGLRTISKTVQDKQQHFITRELIGHVYSIPLIPPSISELKDLLTYFNYSKEEGNSIVEYIEREYRSRISQILPPGEIKSTEPPWLAWPKRWTPFLDSSGELAYTYYDRLRTDSQLLRCIKNLRSISIDSQKGSGRHSRHNLAMIYRPEDARHWGIKRVPCSLYYQFLVRESTPGIEKFYMIYNIRSMDFYKFFLVDVSIALRIGAFISQLVMMAPHTPYVEEGAFIQITNSLHAEEKTLIERGVF